jgi:hypothetical protein
MSSSAVLNLLNAIFVLNESIGESIGEGIGEGLGEGLAEDIK